MKKIYQIAMSFSLFYIVIFHGFYSIQAKSGFLITQKEKSQQMVHYGEPFSIQIDLSTFQNGGLIQSGNQLNVLIYTNLLDVPDIMEMQKKGGIWETFYTLTDTSVKMLMVAFQVEDSINQKSVLLIDKEGHLYWDLLVTNNANMPVRGAHEIRALSYTGLAGLRDEDLNLAIQETEQELKLYPENTSARSLLYTILLKKNGYSNSIRNQIKKEIDEILYKNPNDESIMNFAISGYRMIGEMDIAQSIENELIEQNPKGEQASMKAFNDIMEIQNTLNRAEQLNDFLIQFPDSPLKELVLSNLASALIELDDLTQLIEIGDQLLKVSSSPTAASGLAGIAGVLSEKQIELNRALVYVDRALSLIRSTQISEPPPEISEKEWEERYRVTEARYRDILGWIYFQQGKMESGITELERAVQGTSQPGAYYHLARVLQQYGKTEEAILNYARAATFEGEFGDMAYEAYSNLWHQFKPETEDMDLFLDQQKEWMENSYRDKVVSQRMIRHAPDFELYNLKNEWISLSDQKGSVVLLCFWATWSSSSELFLQTLEELYETLGQEILFLTIAVDMEQLDVRDYVIQHRITLPVLFNEETDEDYQLQGVPTLFLIDKNGEIHFEHKGYRPDMDRLLKIEVEDLLSSK